MLDGCEKSVVIFTDIVSSLNVRRGAKRKRRGRREGRFLEVVDEIQDVVGKILLVGHRKLSTAGGIEDVQILTS